VSLIGTWKGEEAETWNPKKCNILQVVVSIAGLILGVKEPYYLEAGYGLSISNDRLEIFPTEY
jgi:hypothetical protein